jgi:hypothetical protein
VYPETREKPGCRTRGQGRGGPPERPRKTTGPVVWVVGLIKRIESLEWELAIAFLEEAGP